MKTSKELNSLKQELGINLALRKSHQERLDKVNNNILEIREKIAELEKKEKEVQS